MFHNTIDCYRHTLKGRGQQKITKLTCTKDFGGCPICDKFGKDSYASLVAHTTIIDLRPYTDKEGKVVKYTRKLYPIKGQRMQLKIAELSKKFGGLRGLVFDLKRYTAKEASSGSDIERAVNDKGKELPRIDLESKFDKKDLEIYDYEKILAFPTPAELIDFGIGQGAIEPHQEEAGDTVGDIDDLFKD